MAYTLQALIIKDSIKMVKEELDLCTVEISNGLHLVPLTHDFVENNNIPFLPLTDGSTNIGEVLLDICLKVSIMTKVAYVEAEFFGGDGTQGCGLFENGEVFQEPKENTFAINKALRWLGVIRNDSQDEFTTVGLDKHRSTEKWLN